LIQVKGVVDMGQKIEIDVDGQRIPAELNDSTTAKLFAKTLPATISLSRWGDEYYGRCGVTIAEDDDARDIMEVGELAYWAPGNAFCIFFGPTPASTDDRPRAASPANSMGKIIGDAAVFRPLGGSVTITVSVCKDG
jgi:uncharacterized protein